jgi:hypothetical protein
VLETYAKKIDAEYIRKKYPGSRSANPREEDTKAVETASWCGSFVGAASDSAVTAQVAVQTKVAERRSRCGRTERSGDDQSS